MWSEVKNVLSRMMSSLAFHTWIEGTTATMEDDKVVIHCTNPLQKNWLQTLYTSHIEQAIEKVCGKRLPIQFEAPYELSDEQFMRMWNYMIALEKQTWNLEARVTKVERRMEEIEKEMAQLRERTDFLERLLATDEQPVPKTYIH
ncbi:chromosomal replication initiation ATPase DnaA [Anoxybacillus mongoliensis]|uniref:Chromosomal replication initiation ATPase DnaA n=2 Tax=Anoxybacillus TaxID=150247 RepID=A0A7W9YQP0_9BACL|nr:MULTISPECIES: DnaA N-terminal domain-containing protein [Anoxybacillus]MBB5355368.1 chromosomal replication initiation ATPase DnaA [Anoxybacillus mongoliensis]MBB6176445.1 chromosomal replication initiation ATPase DnaA [Anoxybacillus tengchongensis]